MKFEFFPFKENLHGHDGIMDVLNLIKKKKENAYYNTSEC